MIKVVIVLVMAVLALMLYLSMLEHKSMMLYKDCQIHDSYYCDCTSDCKGNPVGCKNSIKKVYME
jgi:hypothetical protein